MPGEHGEPMLGGNISSYFSLCIPSHIQSSPKFLLGWPAQGWGESLGRQSSLALRTEPLGHSYGLSCVLWGKWRENMTWLQEQIFLLPTSTIQLLTWVLLAFGHLRFLSGSSRLKNEINQFDRARPWHLPMWFPFRSVLKSFCCPSTFYLFFSFFSSLFFSFFFCLLIGSEQKGTTG